MPEVEPRILLADHDVWEATVRFLCEHGHDVLRAKDEGLDRAEDTELLEHAAASNRALVTRDKGFGNLVFRRGISNQGIILLRMTPASQHTVHEQLVRALFEQPTMPQPNVVVVIEPTRYRIRRAPN